MGVGDRLSMVFLGLIFSSGQTEKSMLLWYEACLHPLKVVQVIPPSEELIANSKSQSAN